MQVTAISGARRALVAAGSSNAAPSVPGAAQTTTTGHAPAVEVWVPDVHGGADLLAQTSGGAASSDPVVASAAANGQRVLDYVRREFGRNSYDGAGATLSLRVHSADPETGDEQMNNAYWLEREHRIWFGDGDGTTFSPLGNAADVMTHEFFHGVIDHELKQDYVGQEGAIHESFADVLATGVDGNWLIGEDVFTPGTEGDALRSLKAPGTAYKGDPQPAHMKDYKKMSGDNGGVHYNSGIPNKAAYEAAIHVGSDKVAKIWYSALTTYLKPDASFADAAGATIAAAAKLYGTGDVTQAITDAWTAVGITATPAKPVTSTGTPTGEPHTVGSDDGIVPPWLRAKAAQA